MFSNLIRSINPWLFAAIAIFIGLVIILESYITHHTNGVLTLPEDSSFINLTIAKNLAFYRVWGLTKYNFSPSGSSLLFPMILAVLFFIFGAHVSIAVIVNVGIGIIILYLVQQWLTELNISDPIKTGIPFIVVLLTPLPLVALHGGEQLLQLLLLLLLSSEINRQWKDPKLDRSTYKYACLLVAANWSSLILIGFLCIALLVSHQFTVAAKLASFSLLPLIAFFIVTRLITDSFHLDISVNFSNRVWLVAAGIAVIAYLIKANVYKRKSYIFLTALIMSALLIKGLYAAQQATRSAVDVYERDWLVGKFARNYCRGINIAAQDIGAMSYLTDGIQLDLSKVSKTNTTDSNRNLIRRHYTDIAILNGQIPYSVEIPKNWRKIADWYTKDVKAGDKGRISFYLVDKVRSKEIKKYLIDYQYNASDKLKATFY